MKTGFLLAFFLKVFFYSVTVGAHELPNGSSFVGLKNDSWYAYYVDNDTQFEILAIRNPQEITYSKRAGKIFFVGEDDKLYEFDIKENSIATISLPIDISRISQISLVSRPEGEVLYGLSLRDGKSKRTSIIFYDLKSGKFETIHEQRLAVFEPNILGDNITYLALNCVEMCGFPVQEIWVKTLRRNDAKQITLIRKFIKSPHFSVFDKRIYFSMKDDDFMDIWSVDGNGKDAIKVTDSNGTDTHPQISKGGVLYFLRQEKTKISLVSLYDGKQKNINIGALSKIRDLEVGRE